MTQDEKAAEFQEVGLFEGVPFAAYSAWPGLRHSNIRLLVEQTPAHYRWACDHPDERDTPARQLGRATHTAVLEPDKFAAQYIVQPATYENAKGEEKKWSNNATACKAWRATQTRAVLAADQWAEAEAMRDAVRNHPDAAWLLEHSVKEVSMQWRDEDTGLLLKGRMDLWVPSGIVADLKTTRCAAPGPFGRDAYRLGYLQQLVMYGDGARQAAGVEVDPPILIAAEKAPPFCVACYQAQNEDDVELGRVQYRLALRKIVECMKSGEWPGYEGGLLTLALPNYAGTEIGA